jgi:hypothetical protein
LDKLFITLMSVVLSVFAAGLCYVLIIVGAWRNEGAPHPLGVVVVAVLFLGTEYAIARFWWAAIQTTGYKR